MRTHTARTLLMLVAVAALGPACWGHEEATPAGAASKNSSNGVREGRYEVCSVDRNAGDSHLSLWDQIEIQRGEPVSNVRFTVYNPRRPASARQEAAQKTMTREQFQPKRELVPLLTFGSGAILGGTMTFLHNEQRVTHFVVITNAEPSAYPKDCKPYENKPVITIRFCYPASGDEGKGGWSCGGHEPSPRNPHGGDVHAQPL
jgi:hypothetical protein